MESAPDMADKPKKLAKKAVQRKKVLKPKSKPTMREYKQSFAKLPPQDRQGILAALYAFLFTGGGSVEN